MRWRILMILSFVLFALSLIEAYGAMFTGQAPWIP